MAEIVSSGQDGPRRPPPRWLVAAGVALLSAAVLVVGIRTAGGRHPAQLPAPPLPSSASLPGASPPPPRPGGSPLPAGPDARVAAGQTPGLAVAGAVLGWPLDRRDATAQAGPWTVAVRRHGGSLGHDGAVVTYPVATPEVARKVNVRGVTGSGGDREIDWPLGDGYARIRGDLPEPELIALAAATVVVGGRPAVHPPAGFSVAAADFYRPREVHELRYGSGPLSEAAALGSGLTYTAVARCGGFEDQLYAVHAQPAGLVRGRPAVVTSGLGGNGVLAWEPAPGLVAYVGYSGVPLSDAAVAALRRIGERTRLLTVRQWQATGPQTSNQLNGVG